MMYAKDIVRNRRTQVTEALINSKATIHAQGLAGASLSAGSPA